MARGTLRLIRGWIGAVFATSLAAASHGVAGGHVPPLSLFVFSLALSGLVCTILAGRTLSLWRLVLGVVGSQGVFHGLFSLGSVSPGGASSTHASHATHQMTAMSHQMGTTMPAMDGSSATMWLSHCAAALVTIAFLRHGEAAAISLASALSMRIAPRIRLVQFIALESSPVVNPGLWPVRVLVSLGIPGPVTRYRGPPLQSVLS